MLTNEKITFIGWCMFWSPIGPVKKLFTNDDGIEVSCPVHNPLSWDGVF